MLLPSILVGINANVFDCGRSAKITTVADVITTEAWHDNASLFMVLADVILPIYIMWWHIFSNTLHVYIKTRSLTFSQT